MAAAIEERVVQMKFDNAQFEKGAKKSLETLDKLDGVLDQLGKGGLDQLTSTLEKVEYRFSSLGIAGMTAIQRITNSVIDLTKSLVMAVPNQIISGGRQRAQNLAQAQFQLKGLGIEWSEIEEDLNYGIMETAYGLDDAAVAAAQLAASKIDWKTEVDGVTDMGHALRAISGVAGMTNSEFSEIANVFIAAAGAGKVSGDTLARLSYRGLNVAATLAEQLYDTDDHIKYTEEQIREMVSKGEIDFVTFAKAMDKAFGPHAKEANDTYTGSLANMKAALSRIGADFFTPYMSNMTPIFNNLKAMFNRMREVTKPFAKSKFTNWMGRFSSLVVALSDKVQFDWLENLLKLAGNAGDRLLNTITDIYKIFNVGRYSESFLRGTLDEKSIERWMNLRRIIIGVRDALDMAKTFAKKLWTSLTSDISGSKIVDFFDTVLEKAGEIGIAVAKFRARYMNGNNQIDKLVEKISNLLKSFGQVGKSAFGVVGEIARQVFDFLSGHAGGALEKTGTFFDRLGTAITNANTKLAGWLDNVKAYLQEHPIFTNGLETLSDIFSRITGFIGKVSDGVSNLVQTLFGLKEGESLWSSFWGKIESVWDKVSGGLTKIWDSLMGALSGDGVGLEKVTKSLSTIAGFFLAWRWIDKDASPAIKRLRNTLGGFVSMFHEFINIPTRINGTLGALAGNFRSMRELNQAKAIKELALSLLMLAGALWIMSSIPEDRLEKSAGTLLTLMVALGGMLTLLYEAMNVTSAGKGKGLASMLGLDAFEGSAKLFGIAAAMIGIGIALLAVAGALKIISTIDSDKMKQTLVAFMAVLIAVFGFVALMSTKLTSAGKMMALGVALLGLAAALLVIVLALGIISLIPKEQLKKAVIAMAAVLGVIFVAMALFSTKFTSAGKMLAAGVALMGVAAALLAVAVALGIMALIPAKKIDTALKGLIGSLLAMTVALLLLGTIVKPGKVLAGAAALLIASAAMVILAVAFGILSLIPAENIERGLVAMIGLLGVMVIALAALSLVGPMAIVAAGALLIVSVAVVIAAAGLVVLAIALNILNTVKVKPDYLVAIAGALIALGIAGVIFGLGGIGLALGGAGLLVLAIALNAMNGVNVKADYLLGLGGALLALGIAGVVFGIGGLGLLIGGLGLKSLGAGLKTFSGVDVAPDYLLALGGALLALGIAGLVLTLGSIGLVGAGEALEILGPALIPLSEGLHSLEQVNWEDIAKAFVTLSGLSLGSLLMNPTKLTAAGPGLTSLGEGIMALVPALQGLDSLEDTKKVTSAVAAISSAAQTFSSLKPFNKQADVEAISTALATVVPAVLMLDDLQDMTNTSMILTNLGEALQTFGSRKFFSKENDVSSIAIALEKIIPAVLLLDQISDAEGMKYKLDILGEAIESFSSRGWFSKKQDLVPVGEGLMYIATALASITDDQIVRVSQLGTILMTDFGSGLASYSSEIQNTFLTMFNNIIMTASSYRATWMTLGGNITAGIANGIISRAGEAVRAIQVVASSLQSAFQSSIDAHSPSRVFEHLASYIPAGVAKGIEGGTGEVTDAMITAMSPAMMVLMALMGEDYNFSPTITPVVDLSNVSSAANAVGGMFGDTSFAAGYDGRVSGLVDNLGNLATQMGEVTNVTNNTGDTYNFNIYQTEGQDAEAMANVIAAKLGAMATRRGVNYG